MKFVSSYYPPSWKVASIRNVRGRVLALPVSYRPYQPLLQPCLKHRKTWHRKYNCMVTRDQDRGSWRKQ